MKKVVLSSEDQRRIDEGIGHLANILGEIYGDASEVEVLIGLAVSAAHEHGIDRAAFFNQVHEVYGHVSDFRDRLDRFEAELGEVDETEDERTEPVGRELLS
jgi:hypothetical protein